MGNDDTISWRGRRYQIPAEQAKPRMRKAAVRFEQRPDGELWLRWQNAWQNAGKPMAPYFAESGELSKLR